MSLHAYDPRLLEMMYQLTLHQKHMTPKEIADNITIQGEKVSERTIKRWFKWLKGKHYFTYYPTMRAYKLGLVSIIAILHDVKNDEVLEIMPYKVYLMRGVDISKSQNCFVAQYLIPKGYIGAFKKFWQTAKNKGLISNYKLLPLYCAFVLFSPFHKHTTREGDLIFKEKITEPIFTKFAIDELKLNKRIEISPLIKENPIIVPLLLEFHRDHTSTRRVWQNLKERLSSEAWHYIRNKKVREGKRDGSALVYIQRAFKTLNCNYAEFFTQNRIAYSPLYSKENNVNVILTLKLKKHADMIRLSEELCSRAIYLICCKISKSNTLLLDFVTNSKELVDVLGGILPKYGERKDMLYIDYHKSKDYWSTKNWMKSNYYNLFDPETASWRFEIKKYLGQLNALSSRKR